MSKHKSKNQQAPATTSTDSSLVPDISVIVAAYNVADYLRKCLDSLIHQTHQNIEIICIDDGSSDDTQEIIREYADRDARIVPIYNSENVGVSVARNLGMERARAEFLMACDGDDFYEPEMCEHMLQAAQASGADAVACEDNIIYQAHPEMKPSDDFYYSLKFSGLRPMSDVLVRETDLSVHNKLFRKSLIDEYQLRYPEGLFYEDAYFVVAFFCISDSIYYLNERLYNYVRREKSTMSSTWSSDRSKDTAIDHLYEGFRLYDFLQEHQLFTRFGELFWQMLLRFANFALDNSKTSARRRQVRTELSEFMCNHTAELTQADEGTRNALRELANRHFLPNPTRLKRLVLKLMPTYRLQIENVLRIRILQIKNRDILNQALDQFNKEEYHHDH